MVATGHEGEDRDVNDLSAEQMLALVAEHAEREHEHDWEGALGTMTADGPYYEVFPYRLRVEGPEAILAMWKAFEGEPGAPLIDATMEPGSHSVRSYVDDDTVVQVLEWVFLIADGERLPSFHMVMFRFAGDRILSESIFCDATLTRFFDKALDERFRALPGVSQM